MTAHVDLRPGDFTVVIDNREQLPLDLTFPYEGKPFTLRSVRGTLQTGDYAIRGLEHLLAIERKSLDDLCGVVTHGRERFIRELERLRGFRTRLLVIESSLSACLLGQYRSRVSPLAIVGSLHKWRARYGLQFEWAGTRSEAAISIARSLWASAQVYREDLQPYRDEFKIVTEAT